MDEQHVAELEDQEAILKKKLADETTALIKVTTMYNSLHEEFNDKVDNNITLLQEKAAQSQIIEELKSNLATLKENMRIIVNKDDSKKWLLRYHNRALLEHYGSAKPCLPQYESVQQDQCSGSSQNSATYYPNTVRFSVQHKFKQE